MTSHSLCPPTPPPPAQPTAPGRGKGHVALPAHFISLLVCKSPPSRHPSSCHLPTSPLRAPPSFSLPSPLFPNTTPYPTPPYTHYVIGSSSPRAEAALQATRVSMNGRGGALSRECRASPGICLPFLSLSPPPSLSPGFCFRRLADFSRTRALALSLPHTHTSSSR